MNAVFRVNVVRGAARALSGGGARSRLSALAGLVSLLVFVALEVLGLDAALRASRAALSLVPEVRPAFLVERLFHGAFAAVSALVLLGSLTTAAPLLSLDGIPCAPCFKPRCAVPGHPCLAGIGPERAWQALKELVSA